MAKQRVDNFAAGFIRAGAAAVVAEAYTNPNHMVRSVLAGRGGIESAWRHAPSANGNTFGFESVRSDGYVAEMDPERGDSGFTRSIVLKRGLASKDVLSHARGRAAGSRPTVDPASLVPSLLRDRPDDQDADPPVDRRGRDAVVPHPVRHPVPQQAAR